MGLIEQVWTSARTAVGAINHVDLGTVDDRDLGRYATAVAGSVDADIAGMSTELFLSSVLVWGDGPPEDDLLPDGNAADPFAGFDVAGLRLMAGGQELDFHRDLVPGVRIVLDVVLAAADLTQTRSGPLLVLRVDRRYSDEHGVLVECRETFLGREASV